MKIVFDIGGTKMRVAKSEDGTTLSGATVLQTPKVYEDGLQLLADKIKSALGDSTIDSIAGGVPGSLSPEKNLILRSANLPDWSHKNLVQDLSNIFSCSVKLENDTALGALGESTHGAGKDFKSVAYVAVGTGIGGAWTINSKLVEGSCSFNPGHQILDINGPPCPGCNKPGHLESYMKDPNFTKYLAAGLTNTLLHWPADILILGGGVILHSSISLDELETDLRKQLPDYYQNIKVAVAELKDDAGLYGALTLV